MKNKPYVMVSIVVAVSLLTIPGLAAAELESSPPGSSLPAKVFLKVTEYPQAYSLSCEAAASTVALWYLGAAITEDQVLARIPYDKSPKTVDKKGNITWGNPYKGFVGDPKGKYLVTGYGIYARPLAEALKGIVSTVEAKGGFSLEGLRAALAAGNPVVVWVPTRFEKVSVQTWKTPDGGSIPWIEHEHAMVLCGYDIKRNELNLMDVHYGKYQIRTVQEFLRGWGYLGNQAIVFSNTRRLPE